MGPPWTRWATCDPLPRRPVRPPGPRAPRGVGRPAPDLLRPDRQGREGRAKDRAQAGGGQPTEVQGGRPHHGHRAGVHAHQSPPAPPERARVGPRGEEGRAVADPGRPAPHPRPPRPAASEARDLARGPLAPPRRDLRGRPAGPRDSDPQLQGLRRPDRARRVHAPHQRPGQPGDHLRAQRQGAREERGRPPRQARGPSAEDHRAGARRPQRGGRGQVPPGGRPRREGGNPARRARAPPIRAGGPEGPPEGAGAHRGHAQQRLQRRPRAGQRTLHLAGQRAHHLAVLRAPGLGGLPSGHRHRRGHRHPDPRGGSRHASPSPGRRAATATTPASTTAAACPPATATSRRSTSASASTSARAR